MLRLGRHGSKEGDPGRGMSPTEKRALGEEKLFDPTEILRAVLSERWMSRQDFLDGLDKNDRTNVVLVQDFLRNLPSLKESFDEGTAGIFAVGPCALPEPLRVHKPRDIDLRVVADCVDSAVIIEEVNTTFPVSHLVGLFNHYDFPRDISYVDIITKDELIFYPFGGSKPIDVLFPGTREEHKNLRDFLTIHATNLSNIRAPFAEQVPELVDLVGSHKNYYMGLVTKAFLVRLV